MKSELLSQIPGYDGTPDSRERMFERDKDELRRIGIPIETSQVDPLFEDEVGYRIARERYRIQLPPLTAEESIVASVALRLIKHIGIAANTNELTVKLRAHALAEDSPLVRVISEESLIGSSFSRTVPILMQAIRNREEIVFEYERESDGTRESRRVQPLSLRMVKEEWLLRAWDLNRDEVRHFLVDQILGIPLRLEDSVTKRRPIDSTEEQPNEVGIALRVPAGSIAIFENEGGSVLNQNEEFASMTFRTFNVDRFIRVAFSISPQVEVINPPNIVAYSEKVRERLLNAI